MLLDASRKMKHAFVDDKNTHTSALYKKQAQMKETTTHNAFLTIRYFKGKDFQE